MAGGIGRAAMGASIGTLGARSLGLVRNLVLTAAIGTGLVADSYLVADNVPNMIFLLLGGGTIAAVFVPQLVGHATTSEKRAEQYGTLLLVAAATFGAIVSVLVIVTGAALFAVVGGASWEPGQTSLATALLLWCAPQVFFLAIYWVVAQILNSRGRFSSVTWVPAVSSLVVIAGCVVILTTSALEPNSPESVSAFDVAVLGGATLAGTALQAVMLLAVLHREGFRMRAIFPVRGMGLRVTLRAAFWLVLSTLMYQASSLVSLVIGTRSGTDAEDAGFAGRGYTSLFFAQSIILVVTAVVVASISTVLLQRLSQHYNSGDRAAASASLRDVMTRIASVTVPIAGLLVSLGPLVGEVLFARGNTSVESSRFIGLVLSILAIGLLPNALHNVMLRPFFATSDGRSPFFSALRIGLVAIVVSLLSSVLLPPEWVVLGLAVGYTLSFSAEIPFKLRRLRSAVGFGGTRELTRGLLWLLMAGAVAAVTVGMAAALIEPLLNHQFIVRLMLLIALGAVFLAVYHLLTRKSGASLFDLYHWMIR